MSVDLDLLNRVLSSGFFNKLVISKYHSLSICLSGSRAMNYNSGSSDYDLLVLVDEESMNGSSEYSILDKATGLEVTWNVYSLNYVDEILHDYKRNPKLLSLLLSACYLGNPILVYGYSFPYERDFIIETLKEMFIERSNESLYRGGRGVLYVILVYSLLSGDKLSVEEYREYKRPTSEESRIKILEKWVPKMIKYRDSLV